MREIQDMLQKTDHRPWPMPQKPWVYYQEWNEAVFLHFEIPFELLRKHVPERLALDSFDGVYFISVVAFTMQKIRPRYLPSLSFVSDFHEINVRTYVEKEGKKGVYFINIEAEKTFAVWVARMLSGLPYEKSDMQRKEGYYRSQQPVKNFTFEIDFKVGSPIVEKKAFDLWVTERYCLYLDLDEKLYRYEIHHKEWELRQLQPQKINVRYDLGNMVLEENNIHSMQYSKGVKVVSWSRNRIA
ncbi:DUF2071 domain-containing protein [Myroides ceti]|uniref:DUF2071 domain-containing protein n=1 Tax=Paenimyroides ceti TaxID=395087 RepID=A0ABT8CRK5_9FLAO|nr:DUF2071 domain-containing protein [Paenimyroides ceti]MDN3705835.1 DUF2071 domain-containing protein [Paenimyroides ceti]